MRRKTIVFMISAAMLLGACSKGQSTDKTTEASGAATSAPVAHEDVKIAEKDYLGREYTFVDTGEHVVKFLKESEAMARNSDVFTGVKYSIKDVTDKAIELEITGSDGVRADCGTTADFRIDRYDNGTWKEMPYSGETDNGKIILESGEKKTVSVPVTGDRKVDKAGRYRVSFDVKLTYTDPVIVENFGEMFMGTVSAGAEFLVDENASKYAASETTSKKAENYKFSYPASGNRFYDLGESDRAFSVSIDDVDYSTEDGEGKYIVSISVTNNTDRYMYCCDPLYFATVYYDGSKWEKPVSFVMPLNESSSGEWFKAIAPGETIKGTRPILSTSQGSEFSLEGREGRYQFVTEVFFADDDKSAQILNNGADSEKVGLYKAYIDLYVTKE